MGRPRSRSLKHTLVAEIFYIPGLGEQRTIDRQARYISILNKYLKKQIFFFDPKWETIEPAKDKLIRLRQSYEQAKRPQKIYGVSAGAALTVLLGAGCNAELTTVAGKHTGANKIGPEYQQRAPAFLSIVHQSEMTLDNDEELRARLTSYHPLFTDGTVPMEDIIIEGATNKLIPVPFHVPAIIAGLVGVLPFK
jgi:hypothetical protein